MMIEAGQFLQHINLGFSLILFINYSFRESAEKDFRNMKTPVRNMFFNMLIFKPPKYEFQVLSNYNLITCFLNFITTKQDKKNLHPNNN